MKRLFDFEARIGRAGYSRVAGVDEVGRGPLAGPVVAVAVILPEGFCLPVDDSKKLSETRRQELSEELLELPGITVGFGTVGHLEIDEINILRATHRAMRQALSSLDPGADFALVDGLAVPDLPVPAEFIVKGDSLSASIAAASIVAKVNRDQIMLEADERWPEYGFARNKGYGTAEHLEALRLHGPCPIHRRSFAPVRNAETPPPVQLEFDFDTPPE